jgi:hypothetical protein
VWEGRRAVIAYDADGVTEESVRIARPELAAHLRGRCVLGRASMTTSGFWRRNGLRGDITPLRLGQEGAAQSYAVDPGTCAA